MEFLSGYFAATAIGLSLGLIGGGGSIITIPVLVYLFHIEPTLATAYSLFIVGFTAFAGGVRSSLEKTVDYKIALLFSIPSTVAIYGTRHFVLPHIPAELFGATQFSFTRNLATMILFSIIMLVSAVKMIRTKQSDVYDCKKREHHFGKLVVQGLWVGFITGLVGAGGGFLIIPALVLWAGLPMKKAVGTSLVVIATNSLVGLLADIGTDMVINYSFVSLLSGLAMVGVFIGVYLSRFFSGGKLRTGFGWFAFTMAIAIMSKEMFL